jgi:hypothetical protein
MYMSLDRSLRPGERQSGFDRIIIFFERLRKVTEFGDPLQFHLLQPSIKVFSLALSQHAGKFLDERVCLSDLLIGFAEVGQMLLLPLQALIFLTGNPMSHLGSGWRAPGRNLDRGFKGRVNLLEFAMIFREALLSIPV